MAFQIAGSLRINGISVKAGPQARQIMDARIVEPDHKVDSGLSDRLPLRQFALPWRATYNGVITLPSCQGRINIR